MLAQLPKIADNRRAGRRGPRFGEVLAAVSRRHCENSVRSRANHSVRVSLGPGQQVRLAALAAELVRLKVDVIVTWFTPLAVAAKEATREIPIVMAVAGDPVKTGLVESLSRPGGNVTGMSGDAAELSGKVGEFVHDMLSSAHRVIALVNAPNPFSRPFLEQVWLAGVATGATVDPLMLHNIGELGAAFATVEKQRPDAVIVQPTWGLGRVAELALLVCRGRSVSPRRDYRGQSSEGAKPADLPVEIRTRHQLKNRELTRPDHAADIARPRR
jgi:hypothetical protein